MVAGLEPDGKKRLSEGDTRYQVIIEPTPVGLLSLQPKYEEQITQNTT
jgi:hypothetical protein